MSGGLLDRAEELGLRVSPGYGTVQALCFVRHIPVSPTPLDDRQNKEMVVRQRILVLEITLVYQVRAATERSLPGTSLDSSEHDIVRLSPNSQSGHGSG